MLMVKGKTVRRRREAMGGLARGLGVIRAFTRDRAALTLSDIAGITEMPAATARRCLLTLEELARNTGDSAALCVLDGSCTSPERSFAR
jgi:DNA-binding IclR family transcriptional regulator